MVCLSDKKNANIHCVSEPFFCLPLSPGSLSQGARLLARLKLIVAHGRVCPALLSARYKKRFSYVCRVLHFFFSFCIPFVVLALLSLSLPVVAQIRGHIAGPSTPPHYGTCLHFCCEKTSAFFFLPSSTRVELNCTSPRC